MMTTDPKMFIALQTKSKNAIMYTLKKTSNAYYKLYSQIIAADNNKSSNKLAFELGEWNRQTDGQIKPLLNAPHGWGGRGIAYNQILRKSITYNSLKTVSQ